MKSASFGLMTIAMSMAFSVSANSGHGGHPIAVAPPTQSPSTQAYEAINNRMHQDMMVTFTGNADMDFLKGMIPHHQGAIDMAGVVLEYGKDPKVRQLAEQIIAEQQKEIQLMHDLIKALETSNQPTGHRNH